MIYFPHRFLFFALTLGVLAFSYPVFAVASDLPAQESRPEILDIRFERFESSGLYGHPRDGSLGRDLWSGTRRSVLKDLIPRLDHPGTSRVLQDLVYGLLLSDANARFIENDIAAEPGMDLVTLRLFKLLEIGAYDKALNFYSDLNREAYHPRLAEAGILAMLFNAETSLACLEYKTVEDRGFSGEFWDDLALYCGKALGEAKITDKVLKSVHSNSLRKILSTPSYKVSYSADSFSQVPLQDQAFMVAEQVIQFDFSNDKAIYAIKPEHLLAARQQSRPGSRTEFLLTMRAVEFSLVPHQTWEERFETFDLQNESFTENLINIDLLPDWKQLPGLYYNLRKIRDDREKWALLEQAFSTAESLNIAGLYPFASAIGKLSPQNISFKTLRTAALILHQTNTKSRYKDDYTKALLSKASDNKTDNSSEILNVIVANIDNSSTNVHNAPDLYEKDYDLTFYSGYVMPSVRVWDHIRVSSQDQRIGETALLSALVLAKQGNKDLYPGVLKDVLNSFQITGLNRVSRALSYERLLELAD